MFTIKIAYKGKNILLPKGTDSIKKIEQELASRFPGEFLYGVVLSHQGNNLTGYEQIEALAGTSANKSIKLEAQQAQKKNLEVVEEEKKSEITDKTQSKQIQVPLQKEEIKVQDQKKEQIKQKMNEQVPNKQEEIKQTQFQKNMSINSVQSQEAPIQVNVEQNTDKIVVEQKKQQIVIQKQPQIIKCQIFKPPVQESIEVKCTIISQIPHNQEKPEHPNNNQSSFEIDWEKQNQKTVVIRRISQIEQQNRKLDDPLVLQIQPGVYKCLFCKPFESCNVCDSKRILEKDNKFMRFVDQIVDKKINEKLVQFQKNMMQKINKLSQEKVLSKKIQVQQKKIKKTQSKIIGQQKQLLKAAFYEITDSQFNKKASLITQNIDWTFIIRTKDHIKQNMKICLIEQRSGQIIKIQLKNQTKVHVGPYKADKQGKFQKTYRLCILQQDGSIQLFGPKFGFNVNVTKQQVKKVLTNTFRKTVQEIKKGYKVDKSTEYIIEKLKEIEINQDNFTDTKDMLPDIVCTL